MVNIGYPSPGLVERVGFLGFDLAFIDCEKGSASVERIEEMCRAARAGGIHALVRPWLNDAGLISRYLDIGADGIVMASVDDTATARSLVEAVRYARYADHQEKLIVAMIESPRAIENLSELMQVEGIDAWFVGPNDLAHRLGFPGGAERDHVRVLVRDTLKRIVASGRIAGTVATGESVRELQQLGVCFFMARLDDFLVRGAREFQRAAGILAP